MSDDSIPVMQIEDQPWEDWVGTKHNFKPHGQCPYCEGQVALSEQGVAHTTPYCHAFENMDANTYVERVLDKKVH